MPEKERKDQVQVNFKASHKLTAYLYDLVDEEGFGNTPITVAQSLVWRAIEELIKAKILDRRKGKYPTDK